LLVTKNLKFAYDEAAALNFPDWEVASGDHALILGPSGCGKTTLLHLLSGLLRPTSGSVVIEGTHLEALSSSALDRYRGQHIGFVFQKPHLIGSLTVEENIRLATFFGHKPKRNKEINQVLEDLQIRDLAHRKVYEVSQGQAQRVAIARSVINQPAVIFGDEPTASLDDESCTAVVQLLKSQAEACGATLIIATHDHRVKSEFPNQLTL